MLMTLPPNFIRLEPGELISTYMAALWRANGENETPKEFFNTFFPDKLRSLDANPTQTSLSYAVLSEKAFASADDLHAVYPSFPDLIDVIMHHTEYPAYLPFRTYAGQLYAFAGTPDALRNIYPGVSSQKSIKLLKYCPECAKRDIRKMGRPVFYTIHQLDYMYFCPEHHCALRVINFKNIMDVPDYLSESLPATERKMLDIDEKVGTLYTSQLKMQAFVSTEITREIFFKEFHDVEKMRQHLQSRGIPDDMIPGMSILKRFWGDSCDSTPMIPAIAEYCQSIEDYTYRIKYDHTESLKAQFYQALDNRNFSALSEFAPVMQIKCKKCGCEFYTHPIDIIWGKLCPECSKNMEDNEFFANYVDGTDINITEISGAMITYTRGQDTQSRKALIKTAIFESAYSSRYHSYFLPDDHGTTSENGHERRLNYAGEEIKLVDVNDNGQAAVRFENGLVVYSTYDKFRIGTIFRPGTFGADHIGDRFKLSNRYEAVITSVCAKKQKYKGRIYNVEIPGTGIHFSARLENILEIAEYRIKQLDKMQELQKDFTRILPDGRKAEIVEYKNKKDVCVAISDGTRYDHTELRYFKKSLFISPKPEAASVLIGKSGYAINGKKITCIDYKNSSDMSVTFEDGTKVEHCTYRDFVYHLIRDPKDPDFMPPWSTNAHIGEQRRLDDGRIVVIIDYITFKDITAVTNDGLYFRNITYEEFYTRSFVRFPKENAPKIIGEKSLSEEGLPITCIACNDWHSLSVRFDDGTVQTECNYDAFLHHKIRYENTQRMR